MPMHQKNIGTRIDRTPAEIDGEIGEIVHFGAPLGGEKRRPAEIVAVQAHDDLVGEGARVAHLP